MASLRKCRPKTDSLHCQGAMACYFKAVTSIKPTQTPVSFHYKPFSSSFRHSIRTPNDRVTLKDALNYNLALFPRNRIE